MKTFNKIVVGFTGIFVLLIAIQGVSDFINSIQSEVVSIVFLSLFSFSMPFLPLSFSSVELKNISYVYGLGFLSIILALLVWYFGDRNGDIIWLIWLFAVVLGAGHMKDLKQRSRKIK
ncbi:hypothetical protein [Gracilimonas amylolytica]|uniref:hypothetical protein n=1 Tax=Gracilimonas amylolytica TaxID=1749045 RepID=UPI000CD92D30|nr:hypothetical protein [Gracilimonas amylolytica]